MLKFEMPSGQLLEAKEKSSLLPLAQDFSASFSSPIVAGVFNGEAVDLQRPLEESGRIGFIEVNSEEGMRAYVRTLLFMTLVAAKKIRPDVSLEVRNTLGSALFLKDVSSRRLSEADIRATEAYMRGMAARRDKVRLEMAVKPEALERIGAFCSEDSLALIDALPEDTVLSIYFLEDEYGYFFGPLCPDAGCVPNFELIPYGSGLVINYPDTGSWDVLPPFADEPKLSLAFQEADEWSEMLRCDTVGKLNKIIELGYAEKIIQVAEALHEKKLAGIADMICARKDELKLVLIAGPSSSGKTSTAQRLGIQMAVNGLMPLAVSMDDYYLNRKDTPRKADGSYDFECLEAVDLELFNDHLTRLLRGERVSMPKYNFNTGLREYRGSELQMRENSVLLVEGIHGLNEKLTAAIPAAKKLKLYVSALTPMSFDERNRVHTTDVRLLRRMVRDNQFRSRDAVTTLLQWRDVREGEEKHIFPFQGSADVIFNTTLIYELAVLKKYAWPLLEAVRESDGPAYMTARRLLSLLAYVKPVDASAIPANSILREFVGGSAFKDAL